MIDMIFEVLKAWPEGVWMVLEFTVDTFGVYPSAVAVLVIIGFVLAKFIRVDY